MKSLQIFKKTFLIASVILFSTSVFASAPTWTRVNYTSSTAFIGKVKINEYNASFPITVEAGDYIGAFVGEECRMIAEVFSYDGELYVSSVIQGGDATDMTGSTSTPEEVEFKVWDNSASKLITTQVYGTLFTESAGEIFDYIIGKPNTDSELESLEVASYTVSPAFSATTTEYEISVPYGTTLPASSAYSVVAADSRATVVVTAATIFDADNKATTSIVVTAEDGTKTTYTITFIQEACPTTAPTALQIPNVETCSASVENLVATLSTGEKAVWYSVATDGTSLYEGNEFAHGETTAGTYTYYVAKSDATCESTDRLKVTLTIIDNPVVSITGLETEYCADAKAITLAASAIGGTFTIDGVTATSLDPSTLSVGSHEVVYTLTKNGCEGTDTKTVTVNALPSIDISGVSTTTCVDKEVSLTPTTGVWSGTGVSGTSFASSAEGSYTITYTETENGCSASKDVDITVNKASAPVVTSATVEINGEVPALTATADGTINWFESETGTSVKSGASYTPSVSTASETTYTYYVNNTVAGCESEKVAVTLTVTSCTTLAPTIATVDAICEGDAFPTLTATGTNITWYDAIIDGNKLADGATYTPTAEGTYYASQNPSCEGPRASVTVSVKAKPATPVVSDVKICQDATIEAMTADVKANWYTSKTGVAIETGEKSYTPTAISATTTFYVNQEVNGCTSDFAEVVYTVIETPIAPVTDATKACFGSDANYIVRMSGSLATGATLQWYDENGIAKGTESIQNVTVSTAKDYTYSVEQIVDGCSSSKATATLTVYALPEPVISIEKSYCSDSNVKVTLSADLTGGDFTIDDLIAEDFVPSDLSVGSHTVAYTYEDKNGCYGEAKETFSIDNCAAPAVETISLNETSILLNKGESYSSFAVTITPAESPSTVSWTSSDTKVATVDADGKITAVGAGTATITATSTYTTTKSATCSVTVISPVESVSFNNTSDITVNENSTVDLSSYLVISPSDASIKSTTWTSSSAFATISDGVVTANEVNANTDVTITVTVVTEDGTSKSASVTITIINGCSLAAPTVANASQSVCEKDAEEVTFTAIGDASADWIWENASGTQVATANSFSTATAGTYYVYQKEGDCESAKTAVTVVSTSCSVSVESVSFNNTIDLTVGEGTTIDLSSYLVINPSDASVKTITWSSNSTSATIADGVVSAGEVDANTNVKITVTVVTEDGTSKSASVTVTIINGCSLAAPTVAQASQSVCPNSAEEVTFTATGDASADWVWVNASNTVMSSTKTMKTSTIGTYYVYQKQGDCVSAQTSVSLTEKTKPATPIVSDVAVCEGETGMLSANVSVTWYSSANVELGTGKTYSPTTAGTYYAKQESNGCLSDAASATYTINTLPVVTIGSIASLTTTDSPVTISASPAGGTFSGTGVSGSKFDPTIGVGTYTISYSFTDVNGCENSASTKVTVTKGITVDRTELGTTIASANATLSTYASSDEYPETAKTIFKQAINVAQSYYDNYTSYTQTEIDNQVATLRKAIQTFLDSKIEGVDLSKLQAKIDEAIATASDNESKKGTSVGNIPPESFTMLQNAIATANGVVTNPPTEQSVVNAAVVTLNDAIKAFLASEIQNTLTGVSFESDQIYLVEGETYTPTLILNPEGATSDYTNFTWTSSNNSVAQVYGSGEIVAKSAGSTAITVSYTNNQTLNDRMVVVVTKVPELLSVEMNSKGNQLYLNFAEEMAEPDANVYSELYVYGKTIPMYNVTNIAKWIDANRIVVTLGSYIDDINDITIVYKGNSLTSVYGADVPSFEYSMGSTPVEEVSQNQIVAYPTQATTAVTVSGVKEGQTVKVVSAAGSVVINEIASAEVEELQVSQLVAGTYYILVLDKNKVQAKLAFVKK